MVPLRLQRITLSIYRHTCCRSIGSTALRDSLAAARIPEPVSRIAREPAQNLRKSSSDSPDLVLNHEDYFALRKLYTVKDLFNAGVHLGHAMGTLDDRMRPFIFGKRFNQLIIDLDQTAEFLHTALNVTAHISYRGGIILFVLRNRMNGHLVEQTAIDAGEYAHTRNWFGGVFTNSTMMFKSVTRLPDLIIFLSTHNSVLPYQHVGISEAAKMNIPTVGIVDTNSDPNLITYPVPGNDDSPTAIKLYCHLFKEAILVAKRRRAESLGSQER